MNKCRTKLTVKFSVVAIDSDRGNYNNILGKEEYQEVNIFDQTDVDDVEELIKTVKAALFKLITGYANKLTEGKEKQCKNGDLNCQALRSSDHDSSDLYTLITDNSADSASNLDLQILSFHDNLENSEIKDEEPNMMKYDTLSDDYCYNESFDSASTKEFHVGDDITESLEKQLVQKIPNCNGSFRHHTPNISVKPKSSAFICDICQRMLSTKGSLKRHIAHQHKPVRKFNCQICLRQFKTFHTMKVHKQTHKFQLPSGKFLCLSCNKEFKSHSSYLVHKRLAICTKGRQRNKSTNVQSTNVHLECKKCSKLFTSKSGFKKHIQRAVCLRSYICEVCNKRFKQTNTLKAHLLSHVNQNPENRLTCAKCARVFATNNGFFQHQKLCLVSQSIKPNKDNQLYSSICKYICEICGKYFTQSSSLHKHTRKHSGKRPYTCDHCKKQFYDRSGLKVHIRIHTGDKPYLCNDCGKSFISNSKLKRHMRSHNRSQVKGTNSNSKDKNVKDKCSFELGDISDNLVGCRNEITVPLSTQNIRNKETIREEMISLYNSQNTQNHTNNYACEHIYGDSSMYNPSSAIGGRDESSTSYSEDMVTSYQRQSTAPDYFYNVPPCPYPGSSYITGGQPTTGW